jgi:hypothetical protein
MGYALALAESRHKPERLERLFTLLALMQDRDPQSKTYGNFKWRWGHDKVHDANAVEFCLHDAALLWVRHRDWIPQDAQSQLDALLQHGVEGAIRHRVGPKYTTPPI